jgi:hypothetical protein
MINISPNIFLEVQELSKLISFLTVDKGSALSIIKDVTYSPGIIRLKSDTSLSNFKIEAGTNQRTIKILDSYAFDSNLNLIYKKAEDNISIPNDGNWYWLKIGHLKTHKEIGVVSIDEQGNLTGVDTAFLDVLRGGEFPVKVKFYNTYHNYEDYEVLEVTDDNHAIITGDFIAETNLNYSVVGQFTDGVVINDNLKEIYSYDSCYNFQIGQGLVLETSINQEPNKLSTEFYIARVRVNGNSVLIEDKRTEFWQLKSDYDLSFLNRNFTNNLIGVEQITWDLVTAPKNENIIRIGWGFRTSNWTIDSSLRKMSFSGGIGGKFKSTLDFSDGDFTGYRLYAVDGSYVKIIDSFKSGSQINVITDVLNPINYTSGDMLIIVPDIEEIGIKVNSFSDSNQAIFNQIDLIKYFPVREGYVDLPVKHPLKEINSVYKVKITYSYKVFKNHTNWINLSDDNTNGFYAENSFDDKGTLKPDPVNRFKKTYTNSLIELLVNPSNYGLFSYTIDKGDLLDVKNTNIATVSSNKIDLVVGVDKQYQRFFGNMDLSDDLVINLTKGKREGNKFTIQIDLSSFNPTSNYKISIIDDYQSTVSFTLLKTISNGDLFTMLNIDKGGLRFDCIYDGSNWLLTQNYCIDKHFEFVDFEGDLNTLFDNNGLGKVKGWFGYALCNKAYTIYGISVPNLSGKFKLSQGINGLDTYVLGTSGGKKDHTLIVDELPPHGHTVPTGLAGQSYSAGSGSSRNSIDSGNPATSLTGGGLPHNNMPPYYVIGTAKKLF